MYKPCDDSNFDSDNKNCIEAEYRDIFRICSDHGEHLPGGVITQQEIRIALKDLKNKKATVFDKVQNEHLRHGGSTVERFLSVLFNLIVRNGCIPEKWKLGIIEIGRAHV